MPDSYDPLIWPQCGGADFVKTGRAGLIDKPGIDHLTSTFYAFSSSKDEFA